MKNRKNLIQILALGPVIFIPVVVFIIASFIVSAEKVSYEHSVAQISQDYLENEKARIRSKVNNMVNLVAYRQSIIDQKLHERIQRRVDDAQRIAIALYNHYSKTMTEAELKELIVETLRPLVWNGGESFIWILDFDGKFQLAPNYLRHLEGQSIIDFEDATGRKVIREEIAITQSHGQGFLWDTFTKPNEPIDKQFKQLAFVKKFGIFDWYLGSGEYLDTAKKITNSHLLETINQVSQGETDYFFVIDTHGNLLLNYARPDIVGKNMSKTTDKNLYGLYRSIVKASRDGSDEFLSYKWINPNTGKPDTKLTYVQNVPGSDWIIGSGFYPNSLVSSYNVQEQRLTNQHNQKMRHIHALTWLGMLASFLISAIVSIIFYRVFLQYQKEIIQTNDELKDLNIELENKLLEQTYIIEKANTELENFATLDGLTSVANRFSVMNCLKHEIERANRFKQGFAVIVFDIDFFKKINEQYGHEVGDNILQVVAGLIAKEVRSVDTFGRLGGEEFLIMMPNSSLDAAYTYAERLRVLIEESRFEQDINITISLGVASYSFGEKLSELMHAADIALNEAKDSGRNNTKISHRSVS
ncbi:hypothetical protein THMIRHAM_15350 [Thiomicrorhabdus immobilis]|uniref:diguanylate cyclase n=1 Tax=Thiomicrorhabdus immobilis TaxID=2791037 RepID=A0ABM7MEC7_9GAMM|nr:cache domain-containing protein [Thiomicrorhabdus immobilis]BCN93750.1 hypothetical protein THMIRHAM_15350 [Thiomicrorhabdus immobilis]